MLRALLSSSRGRRGGTWGWAFSSWPSHPSLAGLLSATGVVNHWTRVFEKRGIPEAQESSEYIVAHVLGAKTVKCGVVKRVGRGRRENSGKVTSGFWLHQGCLAETGEIFLKECLKQILNSIIKQTVTVCADSTGSWVSEAWPIDIVHIRNLGWGP
jgi:hypothetical protein